MHDFKTRSEKIKAIEFKGTWDSLTEITGMVKEENIDGMLLSDDKVAVPHFGLKVDGETITVMPGSWVAFHPESGQACTYSGEVFPKLFEPVEA